MFNRPNVSYLNSFRPMELGDNAPPGMQGFTVDLSKPGQTYVNGEDKHGDRLDYEHAPPEPARKQAKEAASSIFLNHDRLSQILDRYEQEIRARWGAMSGKDRTRVLLGAWGPAMNLTHRPDAQQCRHLEEKGEDIQPANGAARHAFMWPHINLEDLRGDTNLLLFLNARGRHSPAAFAAADWDATSLGRSFGFLDTLQLEKRVKMDLDSTDPEQYGTLSPETDKHNKANGPEGLLILEVQERILQFLVKVCESILEDKKVDFPSLKDVPTQSEPPRIRPSTDNSPYCLPSPPDLQHVLSLARSRCSS